MHLEADERDQRARAEGFESWDSWAEQVAQEAGRPICGKPTVKRPVRPCSRPEAWGVEDTDEGPCTDHQRAAEVKRQAVKRRFLELVQSGDYTLAGAARRAGVDRKTLDRWAEVDEAFAKARREVEVSRARRRLENLSDSLYRDALKGKTTGGERIFLMKVYAATIRRRGEEPPLDYDQPERLELSGRFEVEDSARERLEEKLTAVRERLAYHEGEQEEARTNGAG